MFLDTWIMFVKIVTGGLMLSRLCKTFYVCLWCLVGSVALAQDMNKGLKAWTNEDYDTVFKELTPLAEGGNPLAQYILGKSYLRAKSDQEKSFFWLRCSAINGYEPAMYNVGLYLYTGNGTQKNWELSYIWLSAFSEFYPRALTKHGIKMSDRDKRELSIASAWTIKIRENLGPARIAQLNTIYERCSTLFVADGWVSCDFLRNTSSRSCFAPSS